MPKRIDVSDWGALHMRLRRRLWRFVPGLVVVILALRFRFVSDVVATLLVVAFAYLSFLLLRGIWTGLRGTDRKPSQRDG